MRRNLVYATAQDLPPEDSSKKPFEIQRLRNPQLPKFLFAVRHFRSRNIGTAEQVFKRNFLGRCYGYRDRRKSMNGRACRRVPGMKFPGETNNSRVTGERRNRFITFASGSDSPRPLYHLLLEILSPVTAPLPSKGMARVLYSAS